MKMQRLSKEYLKGLGHRIKIIRTALGYDQMQMAELLETAQSQVSKIEAGTTSPSIYQLFKIKRAAEKNENLKAVASWDWILEGKEPE
jgi:transcriptional regulator with XRE-family HTH domain